MAASRLPAIIFFLVASLVLAGATAAEGEIAPPEDTSSSSDSPLRREIEQLRSQISALESSISERDRELNSKDDRIAELEKTILENRSSMVSLQGMIDSLQKNEAVGAEEVIGKAHVRVNELEKDVWDIKKEVETQNTVREALESKASDAEKKVEELNLKVENLEKMNEEHKRTIQKTERTLKVAEEELMRAHLEATSKSKELTEVHGAWLPPWLASFICHFQDRAVIHWNEHGKPAVGVFLQKASEGSAQLQKLVKPHLETVKTNWIPVAKEQWVTLTTHAGPHMDTLVTKAIEFYEKCRTTVIPHIIKAQEFAGPYFQKAKESTKPHIDQIATYTKPHVEKVRAVLKPYTKHLVYAYREFLKYATLYHHQAQAAIHEKLEKHGLTKFHATKELVWFMASALLALPLFFIYRIFSAIFCKKCWQPAKDAQANHVSRKRKPRYADKLPAADYDKHLGAHVSNQQP